MYNMYPSFVLLVSEIISMQTSMQFLALNNVINTAIILKYVRVIYNNYLVSE